MNSRYLVHPELIPGLDMMQDFNLDSTTVHAVRQATLDMIEAYAVPLPETMTCTTQAIEGAAGQPMDIMIYRPRDVVPHAACVFHIHGGGYVMGTPRISEGVNISIVNQLGCILISVDYRIAPETPHPGPLEDCYAALRWVDREAEALGIDRSRIAVRGESAGGGLVAALALLCRDRGGPSLCHQNLIYPMLDDRTGSARQVDPNPFAGEFCWTAASNRYGWTSLLGQEPGGPDTPYLAAPARATDLSGLPAAFIATGALDLFVDEDMEYARRLIRSGVPVELHVYPGAYHGFDIVADAASTKSMRQASIAALAEALRGR
ncbi:putative esterase/lipase [Caenibius tardaugens NBRC 16725]|uniref:Putative esterase/lipase n=1 Tax=Caenibius tardaugens NBRC 16725 TaxID=1219035 RepID=U2YR21_9SPHN|nr:alpha/beta hydrolase [Caenibius tardaugens]AZI35262.1 alpha/beta hydrolase [Caenibius tardaugens NBRC 16725]GAD51167.1 putative esterase/lipase [Caenibius tardaugens NBRC 16725]